MKNTIEATGRQAIAMIELIFAIVIMGIVMMSAPQLISTATKSGYVAIQQEAISQASSRVNMIMGYPWDEANVDDSTYNVLLQTSSPVSNLNESNRTVGLITLEGYRAGTPMQSLRNFKAPITPRLAASLTNEGNEDDMDDFGGSLGLKLKGTGTGSDYIEENATITTTISYLIDDTSEAGYNHNSITFDPDFDNPSTPSRNIKGITVILTSDSASPNELNKTITFRAFSCNIGGYELERRSF